MSGYLEARQPTRWHAWVMVAFFVLFLALAVSGMVMPVLMFAGYL